MVQEEDRNKLLDVNVFRGAGRGILDHHLMSGVDGRKSLLKLTVCGAGGGQKYFVRCKCI